MTDAATVLPLPVIENIRIASPCPVKWADLDGAGATRHCRQCDLDVHDLSQMTADQITTLLDGSQRVCGRIYRRADGTIMTADCPVGLRAVRVKARRVMARVAALAGLALTGGLCFASRIERGESSDLSTMAPFAKVGEALNPAPPTFTMGVICVSPPAPTPPIQSIPDPDE